MAEQTNAEPVQREAARTIPDCKEHRALFDAKGKEEAWDLALGILGPWMEAARRIGSDELTRVMEAAFAESERELNLALDELEAAQG